MWLFNLNLFVRIQLLSIWLFVFVQVYHLNNVLLLVLLLHHVFIHLKLRAVLAVLFQVDFVISQVNNLCNMIITQFTYKITSSIAR